MDKILSNFARFIRFSVFVVFMLQLTSGSEAADVKVPVLGAGNGHTSVTLLHEIPFAFIDADGNFVEVLSHIVSVETNNKRGIMTTVVHADEVPNETGEPAKWTADQNPMSPGPLLGFGQFKDTDGDGIPDAFFVTYEWFMLVTPTGRALLVARFTTEDEVPFPF